MPRKYHRPPAAKRRKSKRAATAEGFASALPPAAPEALGAVAVGDAKVVGDAADAAFDSAPPEPEPVSRIAGVSPAAEVRKIKQDYSYVRGEIIQIAIIGGLIVLALVIVSVFR